MFSDNWYEIEDNFETNYFFRKDESIFVMGRDGVYCLNFTTREITLFS